MKALKRVINVELFLNLFVNNPLQSIWLENKYYGLVNILAVFKLPYQKERGHLKNIFSTFAKLHVEKRIKNINLSTTMITNYKIFKLTTSYLWVLSID